MTTFPDALKQALTAYTNDEFSEAERLCRTIVGAKPDFFDALHLLAVVQTRLGRLEGALTTHDQALALRPDHAGALSNRGLTLLQLKRFDEALASYDRALALRPDDAGALNNRAAALKNLGRFEDALAGYASALVLKPDYAEVFYNRGLLLHELMQFEQTTVESARALAISPELPYVRGWLLSSRMHCCDWGPFASESQSLVADLRAGKHASYPFFLLGLSASASDQLRCSELYIREMHPAGSTPIWKGERYSHDRIRVAYLSADFREHAVCRLLAGVFEQHDHARFETTAISFGSNDVSQMRSRVLRAFDRLVDVRNKKDREVANLLHELEIDIAVDLMGFTKANRCGIFALRPAPVQVNYLGYPGTTGAEYMDYIASRGKCGQGVALKSRVLPPRPSTRDVRGETC